jgi:hypothetical protein
MSTTALAPTQPRNPRGRPPKKNPMTVTKLIAAFQQAFTVEEACAYAEISRVTFYRWIEEDQDLSNKIEAAKLMPSMKARQAIMDAINAGKWMPAAWYLERKFPEEFALRQKVDLKSTVMNVTLTSAQWDALVDATNSAKDVIDGTAVDTSGTNTGDPKRGLPSGSRAGQSSQS